MSLKHRCAAHVSPNGTIAKCSKINEIISVNHWARRVWLEYSKIICYVHIFVFGLLNVICRLCLGETS